MPVKNSSLWHSLTLTDIHELNKPLKFVHALVQLGSITESRRKPQVFFPISNANSSIVNPRLRKMVPNFFKTDITSTENLRFVRNELMNWIVKKLYHADFVCHIIYL